ncbi:uncharacterized protein PG986_005233 [Apiospora aurea]|uniref:Uncharacterized protein n=1 Tax=Apiospora aurea TaxID=335848 RepID=A0ABR1QGY9_9PEZI
MEFHLPYLAWRYQSNGSNCEDIRKTKDGKPLRKLQDMSFLSRSMDSGLGNRKDMPVDYLYEAQSSCVVTGYNNTYWTALSFSDTYFYPGANNNDESVCGDNEDMLPDYDGEHDTDFTDPLTIGNTTIPHKWLDPRHYFLVILSARLDKIKDEWDHIRDEMSSKVSDYLSNPHITSPSAKLTLASTDGHAEAVNKNYEWVTAVMYLLEKLLVTLEKVIKAFFKFEKSGLAKCMGLEPSQLLQLPLQEIRQSVDELDIIRDSLSTLRQEAQVFKEQLILHLSVAGNFVMVLQQANFTTNSTYTFFFGAPTLAAGLFQANILGGKLTLVWFILVTFSITVLGSIIQERRDGYTWPQIVNSLTFGRLPLRDTSRDDRPGSPAPWKTPGASPLWEEVIPKRRQPMMDRRRAGRSNTWRNSGSNRRPNRDKDRDGHMRQPFSRRDDTGLAYPEVVHTRSRPYNN